MSKTVLSHFYNEEYLLPFWLEHHKKYFDHGILVDYGSTDDSVNIIKRICPTWEIIESSEKVFDAIRNDFLMSSIEKTVSGWRIILNITEFVIGKFHLLDAIKTSESFLIPSLVMVDSSREQFSEPTGSLLKERTNGLSPFDRIENFRIRRARKFTNYFSDYPTGRHYEYINNDDFIICWYGYSPFNEKTIARKLQIQTKIPEADKIYGRGGEHLVTREKLLSNFVGYQKDSKCLKDLIGKYVWI